MIAQLLQEVYRVNEGQCDALDKELAVIIATIEQHGPESIEPHDLASISDLRQKLHRDIASQQVRFNEQNAELMSLESLPDDQVAKIPLDCDDKNATTVSLLRQVIMVLENYRTAVKSLDQDSRTASSEQLAIFNQHKSDFIELYHDIHVNIAHQAQLQKLNSDLKVSVNMEQVLFNSKELIALLMNNINSEKETSQYFLQALNEALLNVKNIVDDTVQINDVSIEERQRWDKGVNNNVANIKQAIKAGNNRIDFRQCVSKEISDIIKAMTVKHELDHQHHTELALQFKDMEEKLAQVEAQAQHYKTQLDEQKELTLQDVLTKLPNRAALDQRFENEFQNAKDYDKPLWVVVADIDHFKNINDTYGHNAGDKTLQVIASAISRSLRGSEFIARYGGEEFVFLIPMAGKGTVNTILNRVRENIKSIPFKFKQESINITISLGATKVKLEDKSPESTFERADQALYKAKSNGRDQVIIN